jgi:hypothetical protein
MDAFELQLPGFDAMVDHGRRWMIAGTRRALARAGARVPVDALPDAALLDPRVHAFAYWPGAPIPIEQVLVGLLPPAARPPATRVVADGDGVVHLPGLGCASGLPPWAGATLLCSGRDVTIEGATWQPPTLLPGGAELATRVDPSWQRVLLHDAPAHDLGIEACAVRHRGTVERALGWLRALDRSYFAELSRDLRLLVLFCSDRVGSRTNLSAHGAAFLHCEPDAGAPFFCEDLAHQVGHLTFYAVTADPRRCFRIPPRTPIARVGGPAWDHRSLFDALHGNFTIVRMVQVLGALLDRVALAPLERAETVGRLALALDRLERGLDSVDDARLFTPEIWSLHRVMREFAATMRRRHGARVDGVDLAEQPYVFSWATYRRRNRVAVAAEQRRTSGGVVLPRPHRASVRARAS